MNYLVLFLALGLGNFIYQYFAPIPNFEIGFERTYFQGVALLGCWIVNKIFI